MEEQQTVVLLAPGDYLLGSAPDAGAVDAGHAPWGEAQPAGAVPAGAVAAALHDLETNPVGYSERQQVAARRVIAAELGSYDQYEPVPFAGS